VKPDPKNKMSGKDVERALASLYARVIANYQARQRGRTDHTQIRDAERIAADVANEEGLQTLAVGTTTSQ